jgi:hypothetical protein
VTEGKVTRPARGNLSDGTQGRIVVTALELDQTMMEAGGE